MKKTIITGLLVVFMLGIIGMMYNHYKYKIDDLQTELLITKQNYKARTDSLRTDLKTKDGDIAYMKSMYISRTDELNTQLNELMDENDKLKLKISHYIKLNSQIRQDSLIAKTDTVFQTDSIIQIHFNYDDAWTAFNGVTHYDKFDIDKTFTRIDGLTINAPLNVGITKDYNVVITSKNPNLKITEVTGVTTLQKPKRERFKFSHGIQLGLGLQYGLINKQFDVGPSLMYGIELNF